MHKIENRRICAKLTCIKTGKELSIDNIIAAYKKDNKEISRRTIYNYLERMKKAYLIHGVGKYNIVGKSALSNREKQYAVDMGFRTINTNTINYEDTFFWRISFIMSSLREDIQYS